MAHDPMLAIEQELQAERASALGEAGRKLEAALTAFRARETETTVRDLATATWHYMIVREAVGMYDHEEALALYGAPRWILSRVGVLDAVAP